ncbi:MAG: DUF3656 domain-containing protein [Veillonella sp.]|nr:DUF3656 domain-containing protein [Veillonella sp.]
MELLAPAGTMENFIAALESGADAIYLGGKGFNARAHAANFGIEELTEAIRLAHILDVSVYVTVNILIGDSELSALEAYLKDLERIGVDAIIVQDLAVAKLAQRVAPKLHLHGSTQMTAATLDAVRFYESLGFTRVVLARELSLAEIEHICKNCTAEIEVFVHGALCVCYSGQCLMSSFIGGRSGNRGACAQPCRLPYELLDSLGTSLLPKHEAYLLSPKDLNYSEYMNELVAAGVTSGSITYYQIDQNWSLVDEKHIVGKPDEGFAAGQVFLASGPKAQKQRGLQDFTAKLEVHGYLSINTEREIPYTELTFVLNDGRTVTISNEFEPVYANNKPTTLEKVRDQVGRLGNTLFTLGSMSIPDGPYMWPASVLNALRRDAVEALENLLLTDHEAAWAERAVEPRNMSSLVAKSKVQYTEPMVSARVDELDGVKAAIEGGAKKIIFGGDRLQRKPYEISIYEQVAKLCKEHNVLCVFATPRVVKDDEVDAYMNTLKAIVESKPDSISIHMPQALLWLRELGYSGAIEADTGLNIFNGSALQVWQDFNMSSIAPSLELTLAQLVNLQKSAHLPLEVMVHGYTEMMISEYCAIASFVGTGKKENCPMPCVTENYALKDRKGEVFPLRTDPYCRMHIMNSHEMDMRAYVPELYRKGLHILRIDGRHMDPHRLRNIVADYVSIQNGTKEAPPKSVGKDDTPITRGHYFRGIL